MNPTFILKKRVIFSTIALCLIVSAAVYFVVIPKTINIDKYRPEIKKIIEEKLQHPILLEKLELETTWDLSAKIKTKYLAIKHKNNSPFVSTESPYIKVFLPLLIKKEVLINEISLNDLNLKAVRNKNGKLDVLELIPKVEVRRNDYKFFLKNTDIKINHYNLNLEDEFLNPVQKVEFTGDKILISDFTLNKFIKLDTAGQIYLNNKLGSNFNLSLQSKLPLNKSFRENEFKVSGFINDFSMDKYKIYIKKYLSPQLKTFNGQGNINFNVSQTPQNLKIEVDSNVKNLVIVHSKKGTLANLTHPVKISAKGNYSKNKLQLEQVIINGKNYDLKADGVVDNLCTPEKNIDFNLKINKSRIESFLNDFPDGIKIPKDIIKNAKKNNLRGNIQGQISLKGALKHPDMYGFTEVDDLRLLDETSNTPGSFGKVKFEKDTILIDTKAFITPKQQVITKGSVQPFNKKIDLYIQSSPNMDLAKTHRKLLAVREIITFKLGPVPDMKVFNGLGKIELSIKGSAKKPSMEGKLEVKNGSLNYSELAKQAENVNGEIIFKGNKFIYDNIIGFVEGCKVTVNGYSTFEGNSNVNLKLSSVNLASGLEFINNSILLKELKENLQIIQNAKGSADGEINLKGTKTNVTASGYLNFKNATVTLKDLGESVKNVNGKITFDKNRVYFRNLKCIIANSTGNLNGEINDKNLNLVISFDKLNLAKALNVARKSRMPKQMQTQLNDIIKAEGRLKTKIKLAGKIDSKNISPDLLKEAVFDVVNVIIEHKQLTPGLPIKLQSGQIRVSSNSAVVPSLKANMLDTPFLISGMVSNLKTKPTPHFKININKLDLKKTEKISKLNFADSSLLAKLKSIVSSYKDSKGFVDIVAKIQGNKNKVYLNFENASTIYTPLNMPLLVHSGSIVFDDNNINFKNLHSKLSKTDIFLNGKINNYQKRPVFDLFVDAKAYSDDLQKYINPFTDYSFESEGVIPITASIKGNYEKWNLISKFILDKNSNFVIKGADLGKDKIRIFNLNIGGEKDALCIKDFNISTITNDNCLKNLITLHGIIKNLANTAEFQNLKLEIIDPVTIKLLNPVFAQNDSKPFFNGGNVQGELIVNGKYNSPLILGNLNFSQLDIPSIDTIVKNANITLDLNEIKFNDFDIQIAGSNLKVNAVMDNIFDIPLVVKKAEITSDCLNIDNLLKLFKNSGITEIKTSDNDLSLPPFVLMDGSLNVKELIINNLITSNVQASYAFTPDWILSINNLSLNAAGGNITGDILVNFDNSDISVSLSSKNVNTNAITTTLLDLPNEVYGTLEGTANFTTRGKTNKELLANANGVADFKVVNGRLVRLGSLEYLLRASNVLQCGVTGLNINNIMDLIIPQKTGYFNELQGTLYVKNGVLKTDNTVSKGENLSLYLSGNLDMVTDSAEIQVLGRLSKKVSGMLGPLGSLSVGSVVKITPVLGHMPNSENGLIDLIPGLSKIPGLELSTEKYRRFMVNIKGDLYSQSSVKEFKWID